jgi:hypothetical protein
VQKPCECGRPMNIRLRTVIYRNKVEIENVPVYSCDDCSRSEVFPAVKPHLSGLIGQLGDKPGKQQLQFDKMSEMAGIMRKVNEIGHNHKPVQQLIEERINELLDLLLLSQSLLDDGWSADIRSRLRELTVSFQRH